MSVSVILEPGDATFSANDIYYKLQSSYDSTSFPPNYAIMVDILLRPQPGVSMPYDTLVTLQLRPDPQGVVDFNISSILDRAIRNTYDEPPIPTTAQLQDPYVSPITFQYAVNVWERSGIPPDETSYVNINEGWVVLGGIDRTKWYRTYLDDIVLGSSKCIFSRLITNKKILPSQLHWVNWYNPGAATTAYAEYKVYDDSGALVLTDTGSSVSVPECTPVAFPGIYSVNMGVVIPRMVVMTIYAGGGAASPPIRYMVNHNYQRNERQLIYLNGYNLPEGMVCTGEFSREVETDRQKSVAMDQINGISTTKREKYQIGVDWANIYTFRTGYISKAEKELLDEMFVVNMVWEYRDNVFQSLDLIDNSLLFLDTNSILDALEFQASDAVKKKIIPQETPT